MVIRQGDIFWADLGTPEGSAPGYLRPVVVVQKDLLNTSRLPTVVVSVITGNLRLAEVSGNVLLRRNEGNLSKASVVNVTQLYTLDEMQLGDYIGSLSPVRIREIFVGICSVLEPTDT